MDNFSAAMRNNASHTQQAGNLVDNASTHAGEGGKVVGSVVATMGAIRASSHKVADIIGVRRHVRNRDGHRQRGDDHARYCNRRCRTD
ncbi:hypothetical protein [Herbaspirillum lusitanum]|uniref:hypothetical protein n=1 Tax=Herbaspirillum lusitanum TaxID=213312 RepID=UPI0003033EE5|nr:hypothetical protein [Herbaspirillum lusitanum]